MHKNLENSDTKLQDQQSLAENDMNSDWNNKSIIDIQGQINESDITDLNSHLCNKSLVDIQSYKSQVDVQSVRSLEDIQSNISLIDIQRQTTKFDIPVNIRLNVDVPLTYEQSQIRITKLCSTVAVIQTFVILAQLVLIGILTMKHKAQLIIPFIDENIYGNYIY